MVDTKPPLVHQGAIQFMEIRNTKIHKKSKTHVKTVFNRHIFEIGIYFELPIKKTVGPGLK